MKCRPSTFTGASEIRSEVNDREMSLHNIFSTRATQVRSFWSGKKVARPDAQVDARVTFSVLAACVPRRMFVCCCTRVLCAQLRGKTLQGHLVRCTVKLVSLSPAPSRNYIGAVLHSLGGMQRYFVPTARRLQRAAPAPAWRVYAKPRPTRRHSVRARTPRVFRDFEVWRAPDHCRLFVPCVLSHKNLKY